MSAAESMRDMLFVLMAMAFVGVLELENGGCIIESDGRDICLPTTGELLNIACGYC